MSRGIDWIGAYTTPKTYSEILAESRKIEGEPATGNSKPDERAEPPDAGQD